MREYGWRRSGTCKWAVSWRSANGEPSWHCGHEEYCQGCGKVLRASITDGECPGYHPAAEADLAAIAAKHAEDETRIAAASQRNRWQTRPVITGPQGYRRRKGA